MNTNKSKHTPGPWVVKPIKDGFHDGKAFIFGPQLDKSEYRPAPVVLLVDKPCKDKDEHAANLRLCAAAPELLSALESALNQLDALSDVAEVAKLPRPESTEAYKTARAAIAKAKGNI